MLANPVKATLAEGGSVYGCFLRWAEPSIAELVAMQGWDFLIFDGEHGTLEARDVENLARAADARGIPSIARVPTNQAHDILRFLDTGIHGVHVPWVNTATAAADAVRSVKYSPEGRRGLAASRASDWGMYEPIGDYTRRANRETLVVIHIETIEAVEAIDEYVATDGIDVLFLGPTDLSHSLGHPGEVDHPDVAEAMQRVATAVAPSSKALGVYARTSEHVKRWQDHGARYFATSPDGFIKAGMTAYLESARS